MKNKAIGFLLLNVSAFLFLIESYQIISTYNSELSFESYIANISNQIHLIFDLILGLFIYKSLCFKKIITNKSNKFQILVFAMILINLYEIISTAIMISDISGNILSLINYSLPNMLWLISILLIRYDKIEFKNIVYPTLYIITTKIYSVVNSLYVLKLNTDSMAFTSIVNAFLYSILALIFIILFINIIKESINENNLSSNSLINSGFKFKKILNITIFFTLLFILKSFNYIIVSENDNLRYDVSLKLQNYFSYPLGLSISFLFVFLILIKDISKDFKEFKDNGNISINKIKSVGIRFKNIIKYLLILIGINILLAFMAFLITKNGSMETLKFLQTLSLIPPLMSLAYFIYYFMEINNIANDLINCERKSEDNNSLINLNKIKNVGDKFNSIYKLMLSSSILIIISISFFSLPIILDEYKNINNIEPSILIIESLILFIVSIIYIVIWNNIGNDLMNCDKELE